MLKGVNVYFPSSGHGGLRSGQGWTLLSAGGLCSRLLNIHFNPAAAVKSAAFGLGKPVCASLHPRSDARQQPCTITRWRRQESHLLLGGHAQQPTDLVTRRAQHAVQPFARFAFEVVAIQAVVVPHVPDDGLHRLACLEPLSFLIVDAFDLAPVAQINKRRCWFGRAVLHQYGGLIQLLVQGMVVLRVAVKGTDAHNKVAFGGLAMPTFTPHSSGVLALPLLLQSTSGACRASSLRCPSHFLR